VATAFTTPRTWVTGEVVTAALLNTHIRDNQNFLIGAKGADIASTAAVTLGTDGNYFDITGTTTITSLSTLGAGRIVILQFDGVLTFTHNSTNLILAGGVNATTQAGDVIGLISLGSGNWREIFRTEA